VLTNLFLIIGKNLGSCIGKMNIILVGFRGCGKSTISRNLGSRLDKKVLSTDDMIEMGSGKKIKEIVETKGWSKFRELESSLIKDLMNSKNELIIDLGGGFVDVASNFQLVKKGNIIIWVDCSISEIKKRIKGRPSVTGKGVVEEVDELYGKRVKLYKKLADFKVDTTKDSVTNSVSLIVEFLNK
jgi:shikimate kinase